MWKQVDFENQKIKITLLFMCTNIMCYQDCLDSPETTNTGKNYDSGDEIFKAGEFFSYNKNQLCINSF